ncbi:MAG TPA: LytR C-terminal domain-containing protein [Actinomycetota bacterium]|jgi:hypothetical protein
MGAHEPPTNRSFYLSLAASTLRFVIIIALVVGGIVVIDQAFPAPSAGSDTESPLDGGTPPVSETPSPTPTQETGSQEPEASPTIVGTRIAVFNGAGVSGLAGETQILLVDEYGYVAAQDPADAPAPVPITTIYYRAKKDRVEAEFLAQDFFRRLDVEILRLEPGIGEIDRSVQLAIYLGTDYAAEQA